MFCRLALTALALVVINAASASATTIDLTTAGSSGTINGAIYQQVDPQSTGTGVIDPFVQIGGNATVVQAYNTTVNNTLDNGSADNFNHELLLADVPIVTIGNVQYYEFILDINQNQSNAGGNFFSLDEVQIFQSSAPNQSVETFGGDCIVDLTGTLVYRMDVGCTTTDNWVKFDYALNNGSGSGDMLLLVQRSLFNPTIPYVYLFSRFGENFDNNDGFEEWGLRTAGGGGGSDSETAVPEPGSLLLLGSGLVFAAKRVRNRRKT